MRSQAIARKREVASHMLPRMAFMRLTRPNVNRLALPSGRSEQIVFDDTLPCFGVRVRAGGKRTWIVQYRIGRQQRRVTIGTVETLDPDEARRRAKEILAKAHLGGDPQHEKAENRARAAFTLGAWSRATSRDTLMRDYGPRPWPTLRVIFGWAGSRSTA